MSYEMLITITIILVIMNIISVYKLIKKNENQKSVSEEALESENRILKQRISAYGLQLWEMTKKYRLQKLIPIVENLISKEIKKTKGQINVADKAKIIIKTLSYNEFVDFVKNPIEELDKYLYFSNRDANFRDFQELIADTLDFLLKNKGFKSSTTVNGLHERIISFEKSTNK